MENFYDLLKIDKSATQQEIDIAYAKKARKFHPDVNKESDSEEKMYRISEAYDILRDENERSKYDSYLDSGSHLTYVEYKTKKLNYNDKPKIPVATNDSNVIGRFLKWFFIIIFFIIFLSILGSF